VTEHGHAAGREAGLGAEAANDAPERLAQFMRQLGGGWLADRDRSILPDF
jgi:hypothetical protein